MEKTTPKHKKNTGLLPQYENPLATSADFEDRPADHKKLSTDFVEIRKSLRRLMDQAKAITKDQLVQEMSDLLQASLGVHYIWVAEVNEVEERLHILGGRSKSGSKFKGPFLFLKDSPFEDVSLGNCLAFPRNALVSFSHNPYMLKFNINGLVAYPIWHNESVVGLLAAMDKTAIHHPDEICKLFCEIAPEVGRLLFS